MAESLELIKNGLIIAINIQNLTVLFVGVIIGLIVGSIPGLSATNTCAMILPITLVFPMETALIFMVGIYMASQYGGSVSAILINTPGTGGAIATTFDGFPLCRQGKGGYALGLALGGSTVGGLISALIVLFIMKPISVYSMKFGTAELFLLALLGVSIIVTISGDKPFKGGLAGAIGLLMAAMPADPNYGQVRLSFGFFELYDGIPLIPAMCGFYAFTSMIALSGQKMVSSTGATGVEVGIKSILSGVKDAMMYPVSLIRSMFIGIIVGIIPGAGVDAAALLAYAQAQNWSKNSKNFGKGEPEGVVAPETANNAVTSGSLVTAMTIGIPGSPTTAIMLAALTLHGINPGPKVIENFPNQIYAIFVAQALSVLLMFVLGVIYTSITSRIAKVNMAYLVPAVLAICIAGSFASRGQLFDVFAFIVFGIIGYIMMVSGYSYAPLMLGVILGKIAENNFSIAMGISNGSFFIFFKSLISKVIWVILILALVVPPLIRRRKPITLEN